MKGLARLRTALATLVCLALAACGGGGSQPPVIDPPPAVVPAQLPAHLSVIAPATAQVQASVALASDLGDGREGLSFAWTFGDGAQAVTARATHTYAQPGTYQIGLRVSNSAGQSVSAQATITVQPRVTVEGLVCSGPAGSGWCWQRPLPEAMSINDVYFADAQNGWAVGRESLVLRTLDGGRTWAHQAVPRRPGAHLDKVLFTDAQRGWAVASGWPARLLRTVDGGQTWQDQPDPPPGRWSRWWSGGGDRLVAEVEDAEYRYVASDDGGRSWAYLAEVLAVARQGTVFTWTSPANLLVWDPMARTSRMLLSCGEDCSIQAHDLTDGVNLSVVRLENAGTPQSRTVLYRSSDGGQQWQVPEVQLPAGVRKGSLDFGPLNPSQLFPEGWWGSGLVEATGERVVLHSNDRGLHWTRVTLPAGLSVSFGAGLDGRSAWATVDGVTSVTTDAGNTWRPLGVQSPGRVFLGLRSAGKAWLADTGQIRIVSYRHSVPIIELRHVATDDLATWRVLPGSIVADGGNVNGLWFTDALRGFAQGDDGAVLETRDGGASWSLRFSSSLLDAAKPAAADLHVTPDGMVYRAATGRLFRRPLNDTGVWERMDVPGGDIGVVRRAHFADAAHGWSQVQQCQEAGCVERLYATVDAGATWVERQVDLGAGPGTVFRFADPRTGVLARGDGSVLRSTDAGVTWQAVALDRPAAVVPLQLQWVGAQQVWLLRKDPLAPLQRSDDGGLSWRSVAWPAGLPQPLAMHLLPSGVGWVVGEAGLVMLTMDGGLTWSRQPNSNTRSLASVFALDATTLWVGGADGMILVTVTGGR